MRNYSDSITTYLNLLNVDNNNTSAILDIAEVYLFNNQLEQYFSHIEKYNSVFDKKLKGKLLFLFDIFVAYHQKNTDKVILAVKQFIDYTDKLSTVRRIDLDWDINDMIIFIILEQPSKEKNIVINALKYIKGEISLQTLEENTGLKFEN